MAVMGLVLLVPGVQAQKKSIDSLLCRSGNFKLLFASKAATIFAIDHKAINVKSGETQSCNGTISIIGGKFAGGGYCKSIYPDGDISLVSWTASTKRGEGTWKFLYGTGKWKGVTGGGVYKEVTRGKPLAKGTYIGCVKSTGTYEGPK